MKLTPELIYSFSGSFLSPRYDTPRPIPDFHKEVWSLCCLDEMQVAIAAPRGSAKSTAVTHAFVLASVLWRVRKHVLVVSDTESQAVEFVNDIKMELQENEELAQEFRVKKLIKDSATEIIVETGNDNWKFRILAKGAGQMVRGRKWRGTRPDLIVVDDLENEELTANQERREKLKRWFYGSLLPALSDNGIIRVVGTVMHLDSLLESIMPTGEGGVIEKEGPLFVLGRNESWLSAKYSAHNEDFSEVLWPEKFSERKLRRIRADYVSRGIPEVYAMEYLNNPVDEGTSYFRKHDFVAVSDKTPQRNALPPRLLYYAAADFAISLKERADYTAMVVVGVDQDNILYVVDLRYGRLESDEIIDEMISIQERYDPELFVVETEKIDKALGPFLKRRMIETGHFINIEPKVPSKDIKQRARSFQARMRAGGVRFLTDEDWYQTMFDEMTHFPKARHDDIVSAVSYIGLILHRIIEAPDKAEEEEPDDEYIDVYGGRSAVTGY